MTTYLLDTWSKDFPASELTLHPPVCVLSRILLAGARGSEAVLDSNAGHHTRPVSELL